MRYFPDRSTLRYFLLRSFFALEVAYKRFYFVKGMELYLDIIFLDLCAYSERYKALEGFPILSDFPALDRRLKGVSL